MKTLQPAVEYMKEKPNSSVKEVCEKFMLSKQTVYNLRHHHGLSKKIKVAKPVVKKPSPDGRKDKLIQELLEEVVRQDAIIKYLESKLVKKNGAPV
jgi:hypothetical protein